MQPSSQRWLIEPRNNAETYTYGNALIRKDGETPLFDGLGSERTVTNTSGAVQGTLTMNAFGQPVASSGSSTDPYEFAATSRYRNDSDTGLRLVRTRFSLNMAVVLPGIILPCCRVLMKPSVHSPRRRERVDLV
jgi:hypothetical protein